MGRPPIRDRGRPAVVPDHSARFVARGVTWLEPRFLGLIPESGAIAHGVTAELTDAEWSTLTAHEAGYHHRDVELVVDGAHHRARALILPSHAIVAEGLPSARYAALLVDGAVSAGLPGEVIARYLDAFERGSRVTWWLTAPQNALRALFVPW